MRYIFHRLRNRYIYGLRFQNQTRLHLGCGDHLLDGWANVDSNGWKGVIHHDLRKPLPLASSSVDFIFTEHFIEHIERSDGVKLLTECRRLLKPSGVLRLSTPDLKVLAKKYLDGAESCKSLNQSVRDWGHTFIYDEGEMGSVLREAGFGQIYRVEWRKSEFPELMNLEKRDFNDDLIVEALI